MVKRCIRKKDKPHSEAIRRTAGFIEICQSAYLEDGLPEQQVRVSCKYVFELFEDDMIRWAQQLEDVHNRSDSERVLQSLQEHKQYVSRGFTCLKGWVCKQFMRYDFLLDLSVFGEIQL